MYRMPSYNNVTGNYYIPDNIDNNATVTKSRRIALAMYFKYGMKQCVYDTGCLPSMDDIYRAVECEEVRDVFGDVSSDEVDTALMDVFTM